VNVAAGAVGSVVGADQGLRCQFMPWLCAAMQGLGIPSEGDLYQKALGGLGISHTGSDYTAGYIAGSIGLALIPGAGEEEAAAAAGGAAAKGPVVFYDPMKGATADQVAQIRAYAQGCEEARCAGALSPTGRVSTAGQLRQDASAAAAAQRARNPAAYGPGQQAGHVPDTTWTGNPIPQSWLALDQSINSSLGAQALRYPIGYQPTGFWYIDDYITEFGEAP